MPRALLLVFLVRIDSTSRFGLVGHWNVYHERLPGPDDNLMLGNANLTWRVIDSPSWQSHLGLGCLWLADCGRGDAGLNFHWGNDVFLCRRLVVSTELNTGTLGDASVLHLRGTIGVVHRHIEVFTGYDFLSVGDVNLQGPLVGLRIWF